MYAKIMIGDKEVEMAANAATPHHFRNMFHKDPMKEFNAIFEDKLDQMEAIDTISQVAFIMNMSARKMNIANLTEDDYIAWLEGFETYDFLTSTQKIVGVYLGNKQMLSDQKKEEGQQTGRTQ